MFFLDVMKKIFTIIILSCLVGCQIHAQVKQTGWTTTTNASSARSALDVYSKAEVDDIAAGISAGAGGGAATNLSFIDGTNTTVSFSTNAGIVTVKYSLNDPINLSQVIATNTVTPTNSVVDGTTVDFSKSEWTLLLSSNISPANVTGLSAGYYNSTIWHVKASGADRTITTAWTNSPNAVISGLVITVTNGTWADVLYSCQPGVDTNSAVRTH